MLHEALKTFIQVVRVPAYISTIIYAAADEGPGEMTCFPAGLHYLLTFSTGMSKITQKSVCFMRTFPRKDVLIYRVIYRHICELFQKGEFMDSVDPRGSTSLKAFTSNVNSRELSACFTNVSF